MSMRRSTLIITTTVLLLFGAAACGDDGGDDDTTDGGTETTEASEDTTETTAGGEEEGLTDRLRAFLETEYPEYDEMVEGLGAVDIPGAEEVSLTIGDEPADVDTGVAICEAVVEFGEADGLDSLDIEVQNDENGGDEELATGNLDDGCEAA
jgi:hypothetical protein